MTTSTSIIFVTLVEHSKNTRRTRAEQHSIFSHQIGLQRRLGTGSSTFFLYFPPWWWQQTTRVEFISDDTFYSQLADIGFRLLPSTPRHPPHRPGPSAWNTDSGPSLLDPARTEKAHSNKHLFTRQMCGYSSATFFIHCSSLLLHLFHFSNRQ